LARGEPILHLNGQIRGGNTARGGRRLIGDQNMTSKGAAKRRTWPR